MRGTYSGSGFGFRTPRVLGLRLHHVAVEVVLGPSVLLERLVRVAAQHRPRVLLGLLGGGQRGAVALVARRQRSALLVAERARPQLVDHPRDVLHERLAPRPSARASARAHRLADEEHPAALHEEGEPRLGGEQEVDHPGVDEGDGEAPVG